MRFLSVKDVLRSAQVRCSRRWDEDNLWNHALKKRRKKKNCWIVLSWTAIVALVINSFFYYADID